MPLDITSASLAFIIDFIPSKRCSIFKYELTIASPEDLSECPSILAASPKSTLALIYSFSLNIVFRIS